MPQVDRELEENSFEELYLYGKINSWDDVKRWFLAYCLRISASGEKRFDSYNFRSTEFNYKEYYRDYIRSKVWKEKSEAAKRAAAWRCQTCARDRWEVSLETHHRTYIRLGGEYPEDLVVLCSDCHRLFTENYRYDKRRHCFVPIPIEERMKDLFK